MTAFRRTTSLLDASPRWAVPSDGRGLRDRPYGSAGDAVDVDEEVAWPSQARAGPVRRRIGDEARVLQPFRQLAQGDLRLQPGQRSAEAVVDPGAETEVLVVPAVRDEAVGLGHVLR